MRFEVNGILLTHEVAGAAGARDLLRNVARSQWAVVPPHDTEAVDSVPEAESVVSNENRFLLGAKMLGLLPEQCLVFTGTSAEVVAAKSIGMKIIGIRSLAGPDVLRSADFVVYDFQAIAITPRKSSLLVIAWP
jgi:hypothetical protein